MENINQLAADINPKGFFSKYFDTRFDDVRGQLYYMGQADKKLKFLPSNILEKKFPFKFQSKGNLRQNVLDVLNKSYAVPGVIGAGAAALTGSEEDITQQKEGGYIKKDDMGYWNPDNWGEPVEIDSNEITMEGVYEPLLGISDTGDVQMMYPGEDYIFDGETVTEYPIAKSGMSVNNADAQPIEKLDQLLNFTNYNKPTKGGWLDKYK
jgi:hypothetical protein